MNGPRKLSNIYLSYLVISSPSIDDDAATEIECDLLMCAPHFIGDGIALHRTTHDLLCLLTSELNDEDVRKFLEAPRDWVGGSLSSFQHTLYITLCHLRKQYYQ